MPSIGGRFRSFVDSYSQTELEEFPSKPSDNLLMVVFWMNSPSDTTTDAVLLGGIVWEGQRAFTELLLDAMLGRSAAALTVHARYAMVMTLRSGSCDCSCTRKRPAVILLLTLHWDICELSGPVRDTPHIAQYPFEIVSQRGISHQFALFS